jgi:hypothetical protein
MFRRSDAHLVRRLLSALLTYPVGKTWQAEQRRLVRERPRPSHDREKLRNFRLRSCRRKRST